MKLVSCWPKLCNLYLAGDVDSYPKLEDVASIPPAVGPLEIVTFKRSIRLIRACMQRNPGHPRIVINPKREQVYKYDSGGVK